ncbi:hypothetical protein Tco_0873199 [Tanacetum coccineum]
MYKEYLAEFWYSAKTLENSKVFFSTLLVVSMANCSCQRDSQKSLFPPTWRLLMEQIIQYLGGNTRGFNQITNKDAIILYSLANGINIDYANIFWEDIIIKLNKKHREKVVSYTRFLSLLVMHKMKEVYGDGELTLYPTQVFSVNNWALKPNQPEEPPFITHMLAICSADKPVAFKAPKPSSNVKMVPQGTNPAAKPGHKKHSTSSKQPSVSSKEAIDSNPIQPPVSILVDTGMHKEDQQATGGPTSLGVTSKARANPQLSSGMSVFNLNEPIYSASFNIHSESVSGNDASVGSTVEADPRNSAPSDFVPQQQGMNEGTKNTSYDHLFASTNLHILTNQTKYVSEVLETAFTQPITGKGASLVARQIEEETSSTIKLEDLAKLVSHVQSIFKDLDSPEDDPVIVMDDSDKDKDDEVHATENSQKHKLELEKNKAEAEAALLKAQPSFPNVEQLKELLVKSLKTEFLNILSAHDFSSSLPTELKDLPSKLNELTGEVKGLKKQVHELEIELPGNLIEIPTKLDDFTKNVTSLTSQVASVQAKLKTLDALPSLLLNVTQALNKFAQLFQRRAEKNAEKENLNNQQPKPTTPPATTIIPPKDKGKKAMSSKDAEEVSTKSESDDETTHVSGSMVESSNKKELKKFDFVTESGEHVHLTKEQISAQKKKRGRGQS